MQQQGSIGPRPWGKHADALEFMVDFAQNRGRQLGAVETHMRRQIPASAETSKFVEAVKDQFPGHGIIADGVRVQPTGSRTWTFVIDGYPHYQAGFASWAVAMALVIDGTPVASVIFFPEKAARAWFVGATGPAQAFCDGKLITVVRGRARVVAGSGVGRRSRPTLDDPLMTTGGRKPSLRLAEPVAAIPTLDAGCAVVMGGIDGAVYDGSDPHVIAPLLPILPRRGRVTDVQGTEQPYNTNINGALITRDGAAHAGLLKVQREERRSRCVAIEKLGLSLKIYNIFKREDIHTLFDITSRTDEQLLALNHFNEGDLDELRARFAAGGYVLPK
jgi:fructose-1,6-bisphosphatase/inositol monophosphatase family enzyme